MQLSDMKSHPVIKWLSYFGFGLIIVSFVFFYGWNKSSTSARQRANAYGRIQSDDMMSFLPWRKWENISADEVRNARRAVANRKIATLDPTMQMILLQEAQRGGMRLEQMLSTDPEALQQAVDFRLLGREARRIGIEITRDDIITQIRNQPGMTGDIWQRVLESEGVTEGQYIDRAQRNQTAYAIEELKGDEARVTLPELWQSYQSENEKFRLEVLYFPASHYEGEVTATDDELKSYLDANAENFRVPDRRNYAYVMVDRPSIQASIKPTDEDLQKFYKDHEADFRVPEAAMIEDFLAPVTDDQPTTAAQMMLDEAVADIGSDPSAGWESIRDKIRTAHPGWTFYYREVGPVEPGADAEAVHGKEYVDTAQGLGEGARSSVVKSPLGLHIMRRTGTRPASVPPLGDIRARVARDYIEAEMTRQYDEKKNMLKTEMGNFAHLEDFAKAKGVKYGTTGMVSADQTVFPDIADMTRHHAYLRTLKQGLISEMIPLDDRVLGLEILEEQPTYIPALAEVRGRVENIVRTSKAIALAREKAEAALKATEAGRSFIALAHDEGTTTSQTSPLTRREATRGGPDSGLEGPLVDFGRQSLRAKAESTGVSGYSAMPGAELEGYALWQVRGIETPLREEFMQVHRQFAASRLPHEQNRIVEEWMADKRHHVKYELYGIQAY